MFAQQERQHKCNGQRQQQFASHINEGVHDGCLEHGVPGNAGKICKAYKFWGAVALVVKHTVPYCPQDGVDGENNKHNQVGQKHQIGCLLLPDPSPKAFFPRFHSVSS